MVILRRDNRVCVRHKGVEVTFILERYWQGKDGEGLQPAAQPLHEGLKLVSGGDVPNLEGDAEELGIESCKEP